MVPDLWVSFAPPTTSSLQPWGAGDDDDDGVDDAGAALGPLLAGLLSSQGWSQVFYMLMTADFLALLVRPRPQTQTTGVSQITGVS